MKFINGLFSGALGIIWIAGMLTISTLILIFGVRIALTINPFLNVATSIFTSICILILLPLAIFKKTRIVSIYGLLIASFVFGANLWLFSFLTTYFYWGFFGVVLGLIIIGVGVIPFALIASLFHSDWSSILNIFYLLIITYGGRTLSFYWAKKLDEQNLRKISEETVGINNIGNNNIEVDPLIEQAIDLLKSNDEVSASLFQVRLAIIFERADHILNTFVNYNIISPSENRKPNKVLFTNRDQFEKAKEYFRSFPKLDPRRFTNELDVIPTPNTDDEIYPEVVKFVQTLKEVNSSTLQQHFDIGFNRAARFLEKMENEEILESPIGNQPQKVLTSWMTTDTKLNSQGLMIVECLKAFGIQTRIDEVNIKKNSIEYCLDVALGSPMEEIVKRERDIAAIVESPTGKVEIQAPIPGKSQVGITVPIKY